MTPSELLAAQEDWLQQWEAKNPDPWIDALIEARYEAHKTSPLPVPVVSEAGDIIIPARRRTTAKALAIADVPRKKMVRAGHHHATWRLTCTPKCDEHIHHLPDPDREIHDTLARCSSCSTWFRLTTYYMQITLLNEWRPVFWYHLHLRRLIKSARHSATTQGTSV